MSRLRKLWEALCCLPYSIILFPSSFPQNGTIKLYKELRCPLDQFELLLFSLGNTEGAQGKSFPLCPYCYNNPPFEGRAYIIYILSDHR